MFKLSDVFQSFPDIAHIGIAEHSSASGDLKTREPHRQPPSRLSHQAWGED